MKKIEWEASRNDLSAFHYCKDCGKRNYLTAYNDAYFWTNAQKPQERKCEGCESRFIYKPEPEAALIWE